MLQHIATRLKLARTSSCGLYLSFDGPLTHVLLFITGLNVQPSPDRSLYFFWSSRLISSFFSIISIYHSLYRSVISISVLSLSYSISIYATPTGSAIFPSMAKYLSATLTTLSTPHWLREVLFARPFAVWDVRTLPVRSPAPPLLMWR